MFSLQKKGMRASKRKIFLLALFALNLVFSALPYDVRTAKAALPSAKVIFLTSAGSTNTWTVPADWSNDNTIEVLGAGGGGRTGGASGSGGGGGGAYAAYTVSGLSPGGSVTYRVGAGGGAGSVGGDTFFNRTAGSANTCADTVSVCAKGGTGASSASGAAGGAVASNKPATVGFSGGAGGTGNTTGDTGGGGGGAAGPHGTGLAGGAGQALAPGAGGGGGGSGGGAVGAAGSTNGGAGGNGWRATGSGAGANATTNVNSVAGTNGGGGGGGAATSSAMTALRAGAAGSATGIVWTSTHAADGTTPSVVTAGPGGGGGGAGANTTNGTGSTGGNGGTYGGGGGGAYTTAGSGGQGIIVITYIPSTVTTKTIFLSSSPGSNATWTVPDDWSDDNEIVVLGAGGGGRSGTTAGAKGGGGGAVATSTITGLSPGGSVTYRVGAGGGANTNGGDTFFNRTAGSANTCADTVSVCAKGGLAGTSATAGGTGGSIASNKPAYSGYTGGTGGSGNNTGDTGGGGGSGASILGAGRNGGASQGAAPGAGGGGGGAGGIGAAGASTIGGAGGAGFAGTGGGAGAKWNPPTASVAGTNGGGGGGGLGTTTVAELPKRAGANGGNSTVWTSTHAADGVTPSVADIGPGGGGGGAGATTSNGTNSTGGTGGYGGGGGGAYTTGGTGGQGFIVIRYVPAGDPVDSYWVGGTGDWTDAATHWAATSNGSPGSGNLPGPTTNVHFDSNSGSGTVTVNSASVEVADFDLSSSNITVDTSSNGITITGDATVNKTISGSTAVTFSGTGKTITGGNTGLISAPLTLGANATTTVSSGTFSITGIISGGFNLAKAGAGTLTLSGANSFSGGLTIREGTVRGETSASAFGGSGTGAITLGHSSGSANATLYAAYAGTIANPITVASGNSGVASIQSNSNSATAANFSGAITLNNNLTLTAFDTYPMEISGGITGTGNLIINETGVNGTAYEYIYLSTNPINMTGTITNSGAGNGSVTIASVIGTNVTGVIQNSATSVLTLSGNNTFTSGLTIRAGTVTGATSVNAFGASASVITLGHTSGSANTTLTNSSALTFANPISVASGNSGSAKIITGPGTSATYSGAITLSNNLTLATAGVNSSGLTVTGGITGTGNIILDPQDGGYAIGVNLSTNPVNMTGTLTHSGPGRAYISSVIGTNVTGVVQDNATYGLYLSGANTFTSGLTIRAGTVAGSTSANAFGANANVITLGHTSGSANVTIAGDARTFANPITVASGSSGTKTIYGFDSTFSGAVTLNDNLILLNESTNFALTISGGVTGTGNITMINTGGGYGKAVTLSTGAVNMIGTITNSSSGIDPVNISSAIGTNVTGVINNSATSPLTLSGTNTYSGPVTNTLGTLKLAETNTFSTLTIGANATTTITSGKTITVSSLVSSGSSGNLAYLNSSSGGSAGTISKSSGTVDLSYLSIKDSTATGGATWNAFTTNGNIDVSGNTGWNFTVVSNTTLGDGTDGGSSTVGPGASATEIDRFSLVTDTGTDTVTGLTVTLGPTSAYTNIGTVGIYTTGGALQCSATPSSNTVLLTSCGISVTTTPSDYVVKITPLSHGSMPTVPGASYDTTATVTSITATNATAGTDTDSATITVDNASPAGVTSSTATPGSAVVDLAWTNPADSDFSHTVVVRSTSAITAEPTEGATYSVSDQFDSAGYANITFDSATGGVNAYDPGAGIATPQTFSHTVGSGSNRLLVVTIQMRGGSGGVVTGVTYNGTAMTQVTTEAITSGAHTVMYYLVNPDVGAHNVSIAHSLTGGTSMVADALSFFGVDQSSPVDVYNKASASNTGPMTVSLTTTVANTLIVDSVAMRTSTSDTATMTSMANRTARNNALTAANGLRGLTSTVITAGSVGTYDMEWTKSLNHDWAIMAAAFKPAPIGADAYVVCVTAATSCQDTSLSNGTPYYYKIFTKDSRGNYDTGTTPTGSPATPVSGTPALSLLHYRWRNDYGPEDTAAYPVAEDTAIAGNLLRGDRIRLRFLVSNTGDGSATGYTYRLESASTSCSAWIAVPESTSENPHWVMDPSSYVMNATLTTDSAGLSNPGGKTFTPGYVMTNGNTTPAMSVTSSQFTEIEYSMRSTAYATPGTTYCFRLTNAGSATNFTYTTQPQVSVTTSIVRPEAGGVGIGGENPGSGPQRTGGGSSGGGSVDSGGGGNPVGGGGPGGGGGGDIGFLYYPFRTYLLGLSPRTLIISYPNLAFVYSVWLRN